MFVVALLRRLLCLGIPLSITLTVWLYLYPVFHGCAFPSPSASPAQSFLDTVKQPTSHDAPSIAPFRLLALGDPQLEGDTSLPGHFLRQQPAEHRTLLQHIIFPLTRDLPRALFSLRKQIDLWGNDYYLAHIHRTLRWWAQPTHVTVLGDLLGSQWIGDAEFERRSSRYWQKVFPSSVRVSDTITNHSSSEILGADPQWQSRIINIVGNHDVGYSGDMSRERVDRFERLFGASNWDIRFQHCPFNTSCGADSPPPPEIRLVVLDSMNLDSPVLDRALQQETYDFLNHVIATSAPVGDNRVLTILLTHVPLHKKQGICVDAPMVVYHHPSVANGGIREQNHLTQAAGSSVILQGLFGLSGAPNAPAAGLGRPGVILTGHDHEGCDVYHHLPPDDTEAPAPREWDAIRWTDAAQLLGIGLPGIREITVRSMMGDFSGNAGLLSAWFDDASQEWRVEFANCRMGRQHFWWAVHITDLITGVLVVLKLGVDRWVRSRKEVVKEKQEQAPSKREASACESAVTGRDGGGRGSTARRKGQSKRNT